MKRFIIWLLLEYKRAVKVLPFLLIEAIVLIGIISTIAFCAEKKENSEENLEKVKIGLVVEKEDNVLDMALNYVQNMDSTKALYSIVKMEYEEGLEALQTEKIMAMIVIPSDMVEGILNGSNQPAKLYLRKDVSFSGKIFEILTDVGVALLGTAQAEIYTINDICVENDKTDNLYDIEYDINLFNISLALARERVFKMRELSITDRLSVVEYYVAAGCVLYLMLLGIAFVGYFSMDNKYCEAQLELCGLCYIVQLIGKIVVVFSNLLLCTFIPIIGIAFLKNSRYLTVKVNIWNVLLFIVILWLISVFFVFLYRALKSPQAAVMILGMGSIIGGFLSGIFIPYLFIPVSFRRIVDYFPITLLREAMEQWFYDGGEKGRIFCFLVFYCLFFFIMTLVMDKRKGGKVG